MAYFKVSIDVVFEVNTPEAAAACARDYITYLMRHGSSYDLLAPESIDVGAIVAEGCATCGHTGPARADGSCPVCQNAEHVDPEAATVCAGCQRDHERRADGVAPIRLNTAGLCAACVDAEAEAAADASEPNCSICGFEKNAPHTGHAYKPKSGR